MAVTKIRDDQAVQSIDLASEVTGSLPLTAVASSTSTALGVGSIELGHASDTTLSRISAGVMAVEGVEVVTISRSQVSNTTSLTPAITADRNYIEDTGLTGTVTINNHTGTPRVGSTLWISLTGTASRSIAYGSGYEDSTAIRPTTTSSTARLDLGFIWNPATSKFRLIAYA